jgi:hypothetical protein
VSIWNGSGDTPEADVSVQRCVLSSMGVHARAIRIGHSGGVRAGGCTVGSG